MATDLDLKINETVDLPNWLVSMTVPLGIFALPGVAADNVTLSMPAPPVKVALEASIVTVDVPVVADVSTAVTVAPEKSAVTPAAPLTATVDRAVMPAVEVSAKPCVPATVRVDIAPVVMLARVEFLVAVVTFRVV